MLEHINAGDSPLVSIIILSWNTLDDTKFCIESIRQQSYKNIEIIVVDNGSTDGSKDYLSELSDIIYVSLPDNTGFTGGQLEAYRHSKGDYLLLVNSDAVLDKDWIRDSLLNFTEKSSVAAVGGKVYEWNDTHKLYDTASPFYTYQKVDLNLGYASTMRTGESKIEVDSISGAAVIIKRDIVENVGYFDDRFFAYFEETDLFARFQKAGYVILYDPQLTAWHQVAKSTRSEPYFYLYHMHRNRFLYAYKNFDNAKKFAIQYTLDYFRAARRLKHNPDSQDDKARVEAYKWNRANIKTTRKQREFVQNSLSKSYDLSIEKHLSGDDVTVIIPSYNYAKYLPEAIESVLRQTHPAHRIIVIDDGSTDESIDVARRYDQVEVLSKKNEGVVKTKNLGIKLSTTTWSLFLDADDILEDNYLESLLKTYRETKADIIYSDMEFIGSKTGHFYSKDFSVEELIKGNFIHNSALIDTTLLKTLGGYREEMSGGYEDWELYLALAESGAQFAYCRDTFLHYRQHGGSMGRNLSAKEKADALEKTVKDLHPHIYDRVARNSQRRAKAAKQLLQHPELPLVIMIGIPIGMTKAVGDYIKGIRRHSVDYVRTYIHKKNLRER